MTSTTSQNNKEAVNLLLSVLSKHFCIDIDEEDYDDNVYSCSIAPEYKNVFFIKLTHASAFANFCMLARNSQKSHRGPSTRSYCVNIHSKKVISMCFSSKCKKRGGGKYIFQDVDTSGEDETSSDDEEPTSKKLKV
jgi:hypothetical protein